MSRRSPGDGTLFKRSDGLWVGGVELPPGPDGRRRMRRKSSRDRNVAAEKLRKLRAELAAGQVAIAPSTTVGRWLDHWATKILPTRAVKPATITSYEGIIRRDLKPRIGHKRLDKLRPDDIRQLHADIAREVSTREAQKADQVLRLAFAAAVRDGVVGSSVMDKVDKPRHVSREARPFTADEAAHIIRTAQDVQGPMWSARWAVGFLSGARESEILGLEWDRVGPDSLTISWQLQRLPMAHGCGGTCGRTRPSYCPKAQIKYPPGEYRPCSGSLVFTRPKTKAGLRTIPLLPRLAAILATIRDGDGLVFHQGGRPIDQETDQRQWRKLLAAAGIEHRPQHTIRHSTATVLLAAGVDAHIIHSVIGHSTVTMTRAYQHVDLRLAREAWQSLGDLLPTAKAITVTKGRADHGSVNPAT